MRAINQRILDRAKNLRIDGLRVPVVGTDRGLAVLLGVSRQTVAAWRKEGVIPCKYADGASGVPIYRIKAVVDALIAFNRLAEDEPAMREHERQLQILELREKVDMLLEEIDRLSNNE